MCVVVWSQLLGLVFTSHCRFVGVVKLILHLLIPEIRVFKIIFCVYYILRNLHVQLFLIAILFLIYLTFIIIFICIFLNFSFFCFGFKHFDKWNKGKRRLTNRGRGRLDIHFNVWLDNTLFFQQRCSWYFHFLFFFFILF